MKIGIIGTRGIPNRYGGYEQFVEHAAPELISRGHEVFVYNSSLHPYEGSEWNGVKLIKKNDPENKIGTAGQFVYDLNCILDTEKKHFDVILQLGYTSSSVWSFLFPKKSVIITNMDGLEWKRQKYSRLVRSFLKAAEKWAVKHSDYLIADSIGIREYLLKKYKTDSTFIAYGAEIFDHPDEQWIKEQNLTPYNYDLLIARMEPENNIETIVKAHLLSMSTQPLIIIGNYKNKYGTYLQRKYQSATIQFRGGIFEKQLLDSLRFYSRFYFHGHSVGGTNPSLLEAMASQALIVAHDNIFNKSVLGDNAFYFSSIEQIADILNKGIEKNDFLPMLQNNLKKIRTEYSWPHIIDKLENLFQHAISRKSENRT